MMTPRIIFIAVLIAFSPTYSQSFWEKTAGPDNVITNSISINSIGDVYAGTGNGIFRSPDKGDIWLDLGINKSIHLVFISPNGDIYITTEEQGSILRSTNNGYNWDSIGLASWQTAIAMNSNGDIFAGTATFGIYCTTDNGNNWVQINQGLFNTNINSLIVNSNQDIFAGTMFGGVFRSTDNGENWVQINQGLNSGHITSFAIDSAGNIFAGTAGHGIFRSANNGDSWTEINQGLGGESFWIRSIELNSNGDILIGTADGVFQSADNGDNWLQINQGLINLNVKSLGIDSENRIYAGTPEGIFRRSDEITSVNAADIINISSFELFQNYPNPFNPETVIGYQLIVNSFISLKVYDILGKEVAVLVDEYKPAGFYEVNFNASDLPSGVFIYRIYTTPAGSQGTVKGFTETRKMTLLK